MRLIISDLIDVEELEVRTREEYLMRILLCGVRLSISRNGMNKRGKVDEIE